MATETMDSHCMAYAAGDTLWSGFKRIWLSGQWWHLRVPCLAPALPCLVGPIVTGCGDTLLHQTQGLNTQTSCSNCLLTSDQQGVCSVLCSPWGPAENLPPSKPSWLPWQGKCIGSHHLIGHTFSGQSKSHGLASFGGGGGATKCSLPRGQRQQLLKWPALRDNPGLHCEWLKVSLLSCLTTCSAPLDGGAPETKSLTVNLRVTETRCLPQMPIQRGNRASHQHLCMIFPESCWTLPWRWGSDSAPQ
jgi:hypothetical protein